MSRTHERSLKNRTAAATAILSLALAGAVMSSTAAASDGACGLISPAPIAKAFRLPHVGEGSPIAVLVPLGETGSMVSACEFIAWRGAKPTSPKRIKAKLANGTAADLRITTWAPMPGLLIAGWESHGFASALSALSSEGEATLVSALHGRAFAPPALGADTAGYTGIKGRTREVEAFWWSPSLFDIVSLSVIETKKKPAVGQLDKLAKTAVPAFGL